MSAAEGSFIGFAKQVSKGTPITADASFDYMLFNEGSIAPTSVFLPLDPEVGGGPMIRNVLKAGVYSNGRMAFVPRPDTLGLMFMGLMGKCTSTPSVGVTPLDAVTHVFTFDTDPFGAPYYTGRVAPGNLWGEQVQDMRFNALALNWRGGQFIRGEVGLMGGLPAKVATTTWSAKTYVDGGPQFLAPLGEIELPTGSAAKVLSGMFAAGASIPLDEQWIVGSYSPDDFEIVQKSFAINLLLKVTDNTLYQKMNYDPAAGSAWVTDMMKEADVLVKFNSNVEAEAGIPYSFQIEGNGENQASGDANIAWTCQPIGLRAGKQVTMSVTGTFLADPLAGAPITLTLVNQRAGY